jgi:hypothetical protein
LFCSHLVFRHNFLLLVHVYQSFVHLSQALMTTYF